MTAADVLRTGALGLRTRLGTNLLQVSPGQSFMGDDAVLPEAAPAMLRRVSGVESVAATAAVSGVTVRRSPFVDENETGGINVAAADPSLRSAIGATLAHGTFLNAARCTRVTSTCCTATSTSPAWSAA